MIRQENLGSMKRYTVDNGDGYAFSCVSYGATLTALMMPDRHGISKNVLVQFNNLHSIYTDQTYFFGKAIGRVGGRIKNGFVHLNDHNDQLPQNEGVNTLHGGSSGFHHALWKAKMIENGIEFSRVIKPEEDEFPGILTTSIVYRWGENHQLHIDFKGINESDKESLFNPTVHSYFNLSNDLKSGLKNHELSIHSDQIAELASDLIPTGRLLPTQQTAFDFREPRRLNEMIKAVRRENLDGFDHPFKVHGPFIATLKNTENGRRIKFLSDRNALIVYTLNSISSNEAVNDGEPLKPYMAVALEPQTLPDAINHQGFGDIILHDHEQRVYHITYDLSVDSN